MGFQSISRSALLFLTALLLSCAGRGGSSDGCGPGLPTPLLYLESVDGRPYTTGDVTIRRTGAGATSSLWQIRVERNIDWCSRRYDGALTLYLENPPQGVAASFDPVTIGPSTGGGAQPAAMTLTFQPSVPDGVLFLTLRARESPVAFLYSGRIVVATGGS